MKIAVKAIERWRAAEVNPIIKQIDTRDTAHNFFSSLSFSFFQKKADQKSASVSTFGDLSKICNKSVTLYSDTVI